MIKNYVGCVRLNPLSQQIIKTTAGGMAAVSAGIVAFFLRDNRPESMMALIAVSLLALSIPLLVGSRIFYNLLDNFEYVPLSADQILESLLLGGLLTALGGYSLLLALISKIICWALAIGIMISGFAVWQLVKQMDGPQTLKREDPTKN